MVTSGPLSIAMVLRQLDKSQESRALDELVVVLGKHFAVVKNAVLVIAQMWQGLAQKSESRAAVINELKKSSQDSSS